MISLMALVLSKQEEENKGENVLSCVRVENELGHIE